MSNRLTKSANKMTQGHAFVSDHSDQQIADLAQMVGSQDKDGFHSLWKTQKQEFFGKGRPKDSGWFFSLNRRSRYFDQRCRGRRRRCILEAWQSISTVLYKKIEKMIYYQGIPVDAHDIYVSVLGKLWERCLKGSFKLTQSFYRFLGTTVYHKH